MAPVTCATIAATASSRTRSAGRMSRVQQQLASGRYPNLRRAISSGGDLDNDAAFEFI
jgi:hypothetical protein